jgi:hypothetical protein
VEIARPNLCSERTDHRLRCELSCSSRAARPKVIAGQDRRHAPTRRRKRSTGSRARRRSAVPRGERRIPHLDSGDEPCAESARQDTAAVVRPDEAREIGRDGELRVASRAEAISTSSSGPARGQAGHVVAARAIALPRGGLVTSSRPLLVLGRVVPGKLARRAGCIVVEIEGSTFTAVFPPAAKLVSTANGGEAVSWPGRTIPIGGVARIPGGGSVVRSDLAAALPATCRQPLYAIGG